MAVWHGGALKEIFTQFQTLPELPVCPMVKTQFRNFAHPELRPKLMRYSGKTQVN